MDIKKGRISNINKKLITGALAFTLVSSCLITGVISYKRELDQQRYENFTGVASFEKLKKCFFIEVYDKNEGTNKYYIASKEEFFDENGVLDGYIYLDLLDGKNVFVDRLDNRGNALGYVESFDKTLVNELKIKKYLYSLNMVETMYSDEDIKTLLEEMKQLTDKGKIK